MHMLHEFVISTHDGTRNSLSMGFGIRVIEDDLSSLFGFILRNFSTSSIRAMLTGPRFFFFFDLP